MGWPTYCVAHNAVTRPPGATISTGAPCRAPEFGRCIVNSVNCLALSLVVMWGEGELGFRALCNLFQSICEVAALTRNLCPLTLTITLLLLLESWTWAGDTDKSPIFSAATRIHRPAYPFQNRSKNSHGFCRGKNRICVGYSGCGTASCLRSGGHLSLELLHALSGPGPSAPMPWCLQA